MAHVKNKSCESPIDLTEYRYQKDNKEIFGQFYANKFNNLDEMNSFSEVSNKDHSRRNRYPD